MNINATPELCILLHICAKSLGLTPRTPGFREATADFSEKILFDQAERHKVSRLLYRGFKAYPGLLSDVGSEELKRRAMVSQLRAERLIHMWQNVIAEVNRTGNQLLSFKGPALSLQLFDNPFAREYHDLDFFLVYSELGEVLSVFRSFGFTGFGNLGSVSDILPDQQLDCWKNRNHLPMKHTNTGVLVELHFQASRSFSGLYPVPTTERFQRAEALQYRDLEFLSPNREDHAVYLFTHGAMHAWACLRWIFDVAIVLDRKGIDWDRFRDDIECYGLRRVCEFSIKLINSLLTVRLPEQLSNFSANDEKMRRYLTYYSSEEILAARRYDNAKQIMKFGSSHKSVHNIWRVD